MMHFIVCFIGLICFNGLLGSYFPEHETPLLIWSFVSGLFFPWFYRKYINK